jgi:uracil-DNA glycosylase
VSAEHSAAKFVPAGADLRGLQEAAKTCRGCDLYKHATQTVFGEGRADAGVVFVGEQPGDAEDRAGHPFVGPAGRMLDKALEETGLDRTTFYITNAVKHFKWEPRGKRRIHKKPLVREIRACRPWLTAELGVIRPALVVAMGGTAAEALLDRPVRVQQERGTFHPGGGVEVFVTIHPSAILRLREPEEQEREYAQFVHDLRLVRRHLDEMARRRT